MSGLRFIDTSLGLRFRLGHIILGSIATNCYVIPLQKDIVVIDPGFKSEILEKWIEENLKGTLHIYLTHGHYDHIGGVNSLLDRFANSKVYIYYPDFEYLSNTELNLSKHLGVNVTVGMLDKVVKVKESEELVFEDMKFRVIALPGHTPGSSGLYSDKNSVIFQGDTLFRNGIGRTDFPGGCYKDIMRSVSDVLFKLPKSTLVFTGHGDYTTIGSEM